MSDMGVQEFIASLGLSGGEQVALAVLGVTILIILGICFPRDRS